MIKKTLTILLFIAAIVAVYFISGKYFFRLDLTSEKRYSISDNTKKLLRGLDDEIVFKIYLDGDLNSGFLRLRKATREMLDEFSAYSRNLKYEFINPSAASTPQAREKQYEELAKRGIRGIMVHEKDKEGKSIQKMVFPWVEISYKGKNHLVNLLKNLPGKSGEENLNISIQNLEFELTEAIRLLTSKEIRKVAFIEGHGELPEVLTYDISQTLSRYYQVDRGVIGDDPAILEPYSAIIIAAPQEKFTEKDKYVIDQYIMRGGKALWMVDGTRVSLDSLSVYSETMAIPNDVNLSDQLFKYGIRINPVLVLDVQSALIPVNVAEEGEPAKFEPMPWYYSPILLTSPEHPVTRNLTPVKAEFASSLDFVGEDLPVKKDVLLITSTGTRLQTTPSLVSMDIINVEKSGHFFNTRNTIVAASIEGVFPSVFTNRMIPEGIRSQEKMITESKPTKMIVVANGSIIRNDVQGYGENTSIVPLGFDRYMNQQFGNKDFILNAVNYLTDDEGWMALRSREIKLRLLNKPAIIGLRKFWQISNVLLPLVFLALFGTVSYFVRKKRYAS
ncbi:MAG: gliding motility-associated ABC transporter substrate-binding protein GldG [Prevotellaceae bacterium]|jgi:ABC-2 type transport system permease protein|nr:gliding motility-associated ABC transporter substrate-binding protein GldG [Prevotellaceae bacterium]